MTNDDHGESIDGGGGVKIRCREKRSATAIASHLFFRKITQRMTPRTPIRFVALSVIAASLMLGGGVLPRCSGDDPARSILSGEQKVAPEKKKIEAVQVTIAGGRESAARTLQRETVRGRVILRAADGGLMLRTDMGTIRILQPEQIDEVESIGADTLILPSREVERRLLEDLGRGFKTHATANYVVAFDGNIIHAKRVAALLEQVHRGFFTFWKNQKVAVTPPASQMIVLVLRDRQSFDRYASEKIGEAANHLIGYYHVQTNRMITYDVPNFERNVSTVIHEATHQLAYNCGLQDPLADNPLWMSEGLAMFFESPDRRNSRRWRGIGRVNEVNLDRFRRYFLRRGPESLLRLIGQDERLQNSGTALDAYGEAWALTYFLIRTRRDDYMAYLEKIRSMPPLAKRSTNERVEDFTDSFGDLADVEREFITYMRTVRPDR